MGFFKTLGILAGYLVFKGASKEARSPKSIERNGARIDAEIQEETGYRPPTDTFLEVRGDSIAATQIATVQRACTCLESLYRAIDWQTVSSPLWRARGVARNVPVTELTYPTFTNEPIKAGYSDDSRDVLDLIADSMYIPVYNPGTVIALTLGHIRVALQSVRDTYPVRNPRHGKTNGIWIGDNDNYIVERTESGKKWFDRVQARILELSKVALESAYNAYAAQNGLDLLPDLQHSFGYLTRVEYGLAASRRE